MLPHGSAPKAKPLVIYPQHHAKRKTIEMNQFQSLSFFILCFCFDEIAYLCAVGEGQCFGFCLKQALCSLPPRMSLCSILRKFDLRLSLLQLEAGTAENFPPGTFRGWFVLIIGFRELFHLQKSGLKTSFQSGVCSFCP